jgi:hypothetical protein
MKNSVFVFIVEKCHLDCDYFIPYSFVLIDSAHACASRGMVRGHPGEGGKDGRQKVGAVFGMPSNAAHLSQKHFSACTIPP